MIEFFNEHWKIFAFIFLTISSSAILTYAIKYGIRKKRMTDAKNFADPKYSIGAAIVNLERAMLYSDDENFKFFIRYAIRRCLGMPKSYPPDEPSADIVISHVNNESLRQEIYELYTLTKLPEDEKLWQPIIDRTRSLVTKLLGTQY